MTYLLLVLLLGAFYKIFTLESRLNQLQTRLKRLDGQMGGTTSELQLPEHPVTDRLRELLREGKKVQAVKEAREALGLSLLEAKQFVDELER
ncbi:hypothetical protein J31TS4_27710 [Paenibacillus sp. J31TS4]|uniref:hypothetical protein n=1 Tax=Paenibacillus sp. J31TS4 TaxID=2807195 RepID=UPI001B2744B1|nr:hypothetical protein [Paenibacillus sp. J31TS4]GIP39491.1 hypothetical protein J31TS4_27710 [Paenibacillus sp. J31TS4]